MQPFFPKRTGAAGPEAQIQEALIKRLKEYDWLVKVIVGNMYQSGLPDLWCAHDRLGQRWIEVKNPKKWSFTPAQQKDFPLFHSKNVGIWVLFEDSNEELMKLHQPPNWLKVYLDWVNGVPYRKG